MATGVVEGADDVIVATHHEDRRTAVAPNEKAPGLAKLIDVSGVKPGAAPHRLLLLHEKTGIRIASGGNVGKIGKAFGNGRTEALFGNAFDPFLYGRGVHRRPSLLHCILLGDG